MARQKVSVLEVCVARAVDRHGLIRGGTVGGRQAAFVAEWAKYQDATGDHPGNPNAFAVWACVPRATLYRRLDEFRELFPEHETPEPLAVYLRRGGPVVVPVTT